MMSSARRSNARLIRGFKSSIAYLVTALGAASLFLMGSVSTSHADVNDFEFEQFSAQYVLSADETGVATLSAIESLVALFPPFDQNRGIARLLPRSYNGTSLETRVIGVSDGTRAREFSVSTVGAFVEIASVVPDGEFVQGRQPYDISYEQRNVIAEFDESQFQEFYWDINGTGWPQRFELVTADVVISQPFSSQLVPDRFACYIGAAGSTQTCTLDRVENADGSVTFTVSEQNVAPFETVTVALAFEPDTFRVETPSLASTWYFWLTLLTAIAFLIVVITTFALKRTVLRSDPGRPTIITEYEPPSELSLATAGHLLGTVDKIATAELVQLAVTGVIQLHKGDKKHDWQIIRSDRSSNEEQQAALFALTGATLREGDAVALPRRNSRVASLRLREYIAKTKANAQQAGIYREGISTISLVFKIAAGVCGALLALAALNGEDGILWFAPSPAPGALPLLLFVGGVVVAIVPALILSKRPLSPLGAEIRDHLKGLKVYLELAEKDRLAFLQSPSGAERVRVNPEDPTEVLHLYERLLPWAVLMNVDKQWLGVLQTYYTESTPPTWLVGVPIAAFSSSANQLVAQASSSLASSSSSGAGGGGFAGGGGGGGGGGGR